MVKKTIREWRKIRDQSLQGALHASGLVIQGEGGLGGSCQELPATRKGLLGSTVTIGKDRGKLFSNSAVLLPVFQSQARHKELSVEEERGVRYE